MLGVSCLVWTETTVLIHMVRTCSHFCRGHVRGGQEADPGIAAADAVATRRGHSLHGKQIRFVHKMAELLRSW